MKIESRMLMNDLRKIEAAAAEAEYYRSMAMDEKADEIEENIQVVYALTPVTIEKPENVLLYYGVPAEYDNKLYHSTEVILTDGTAYQILTPYDNFKALMDKPVDSHVDAFELVVYEE